MNIHNKDISSYQSFPEYKGVEFIRIYSGNLIHFLSFRNLPQVTALAITWFALLIAPFSVTSVSYGNILLSLLSPAIAQCGKMVTCFLLFNLNYNEI